MKALVALVMAGAFMNSSHAAFTLYGDDSDFKAAFNFPSLLKFESFETATRIDDLEIRFAGGRVGCPQIVSCSQDISIGDYVGDGDSYSVYFSSPGSITFQFNAPIYAFGIAIGNAGDLLDDGVHPVRENALSMAAVLDTGESITVFNNHASGSTTFETTDRVYFGLISENSFSSVTFTPSNIGDYIFFDSLNYAPVAAAVPEPSSLALLGLGLAGLLMRRKRCGH